MNIGILTYYMVHNHGAVLQANALKCILEDSGHSVHFLTFDRDYRYISKIQRDKYRISLKSVPFYIKYTLKKGVGNIMYNIRKRKTLDAFRKKEFDFKGNKNCINGFVIIGSDEVFSLEIGFNPILYGIGLENNTVITYAASFGPTTIEDINTKNRREDIEEGLKKVESISVRDLNSKRIIKALCGIEACLVCDPVILYGYENEITSFTPKEKDYIAIYSYDGRMNDPEEIKTIQKYAKERGLRVYSVGYYHKWCDKNINATPFELLGWIKNANLAITDTFHGSVISILCNTPMAVKIRDNSNKLAFLMNEYGLTDRIVDSLEELELLSTKDLDFEKTRKLVEQKRKESMDFLKESIEGKNDTCRL